MAGRRHFLGPDIKMDSVTAYLGQHLRLAMIRKDRRPESERVLVEFQMIKDGHERFSAS